MAHIPPKFTVKHSCCDDGFSAVAMRELPLESLSISSAVTRFAVVTLASDISKLLGIPYNFATLDCTFERVAALGMNIDDGEALCAP